MKAEEVSAWLSAIAGLSGAQRGEALEALKRAEGGEGRSGSEVSPEAGRGKATRRGRREDALGTTSHERVEAQGCPHCTGREVVGWGRSHGLSRFRRKSCGRTFNALTNTPMAHLRKKERWLDHARAMIEGKSLAKTAQVRRPSDDGVSLAPSVSPHTRFRQAADVERDRRSGRGSQQ